MRSYLAILSARFRMLMQYRAAAAAGVATQVFWGLIRLMIFEGFYRSTTQAQPMSLAQVIGYVWLGQAMLGLTLWSTDADIREMIRDGTIAYELLRPLDLYSLWFSRAMATRTATTAMRCLPIFVIGSFLGLKAPPTWDAAAGWVLATAGAVLLVSALSTLLNISMLWTISGEGIVRVAPALVYAFSGMLVPLVFLPDWARRLSDWLPFRGIVDVPFRIYLGHIPTTAMLPALAHQLAWTAVLILAGRWMLRSAVGRVVVQGG
jgi:ABC-2 type transport system permease protein